MKLVLLLAGLLLADPGAAQDYDLVIQGGRVIDPQSGLDAIRHLGIRGGKVGALSQRPLTGRRVLDAAGLVVSPGFIDLHWHGTKARSAQAQAQDGVTAQLELELGTGDIDKYYGERAGKWAIHYGASIGHIPARMALMHDPGVLVPSGPAAKRAATPEEISDLQRRIEHGLKRGAPAVGFGIGYTAAASHWEILQIFKTAARNKAACHVHLRGGHGNIGRVGDLQEVIAAAAITGASVHPVHINSSGHDDTPKLLEMIEGARAHGVDITTECYPYAAGMTRIEAALFDSHENEPESYYRTFQWTATGERLTRETFLNFRKQGGTVIVHSNTEPMVRAALASPLTMIASDGFDVEPGNHPRGAGTFSRVVGRYSRDEKLFPLMEALRKMTIMPAKRLESRVAAMKNKGRIRVGSDADITVFDPARINDRATYEKSDTPSEGIRWVLVNGTPVVDQGQLVPNVFPGQGIRAAITP